VVAGHGHHVEPHGCEPRVPAQVHR
jgi:hypothetical protein